MNSTPPYPYIAVEGVIGVGKTTLVRLLRPRFRAQLLLEAFEENPFLSDFYADRARYAFQTQIFFLLSRYQQQKAGAVQEKGALLSDYFFAKDRLFARLNLTGAELDVYEELYELLAESVMVPELVIYLRAETETLMARIAMRDRPYEREMEREYIDALRRSYESLFADYEATPLLTIDTNDLDFVRRPEDLESVEQQIRAALRGIRQPSLLRTERVQPSSSTWSALSATEDVNRENLLEDYLALSQALGELGKVLLQQRTGETGPAPAEALREALATAAGALEDLAHHTGIPLPSRSGERARP